MNDNINTNNDNQTDKAKISSIDDFTIISEIGKGAFSNVYKVRRKIDNRFYALKKVNLVSLSEKERENSFNEIRLLASINNTNVISYKDSFIDKHKHLLYLIMEYADNGDLEQKIQEQITKKQFIPEVTIILIFEQIVRGLKALHDKSIIHRDLKAANIFLFNNDIVKIGDMNVSKVIRKGVKNTQTGTPYYASPEIWENKPYDFKSDIWSLGCLCYEMAALKAPFRGTSMSDVYNKVIKGFFDIIPNQYSKDLFQIIKMCLNAKSEERPNCIQLLHYIKKIKEVQMPSIEKIDTQSLNKKEIFKKIKLNLDLKDINIKLPISRYGSKLRLRNNISIKDRLKGIRRYYKNSSQINQTEIQDQSIKDNDHKVYSNTLDNRNHHSNSNFNIYKEDKDKERAKLRFNYSANNIRTEVNDNFNKNYSKNQIRIEAINKQKAQIEKELGIKKISKMKRKLLAKESVMNQSKDYRYTDKDNMIKGRSISPIKRPPSAHHKLRFNKDLMNLTNDNKKEKNKSNHDINVNNKQLEDPQQHQQKQEKEDKKDKAVNEAIGELLQFNAEQSKQLAEKYLEQQRALSANKALMIRSKSDNIKAVFSSYNAIQTEQNTSVKNNQCMNLPRLNNGKAPIYLHSKNNNSVQMFDIFHNVVPDQHGKKIKKINLNYFNKKGDHKLKKSIVNKKIIIV